MRTVTRFSVSIHTAAPLLIMGGLMLISFSLLKSTQTPYLTKIEPKQNEHDYYVTQFSSAQLNPSGRLASLIKGRHALHSLTTKSIFINDFLFSSNNAVNLYLGYAGYAEFDDDGKSLTLKNNAELTRWGLQAFSKHNVTRLKSNYLQLNQYPEQLISYTFTEIEQNNRKMSAQSMQYDYDEQKIQLLGGVKIKVNAKK